MLSKLDPRSLHRSSMERIQGALNKNKVSRSANFCAALTCTAAFATQLFVLIFKDTMVGCAKGAFRVARFEPKSPNWSGWKKAASKTAYYAAGVFLSAGAVIFPHPLSKRNAAFHYRNGLFSNDEMAHRLSSIEQFCKSIDSKDEEIEAKKTEVIDESESFELPDYLRSLGSLVKMSIDNFVETKLIKEEFEKIGIYLSFESKEKNQAALTQYRKKLVNFTRNGRSLIEESLNEKFNELYNCIGLLQNNLALLCKKSKKILESNPISVDELKEAQKNIYDSLDQIDNLPKELEKIIPFRGYLTNPCQQAMNTKFTEFNNDLQEHRKKIFVNWSDFLKTLHAKREEFEQELLRFRMDFFFLSLLEFTTLSKFVWAYTETHSTLINSNDLTLLNEKKIIIERFFQQMENLKTLASDFNRRLEAIKSRFIGDEITKTFEQIQSVFKNINEMTDHLNESLLQLNIKIKTLSDEQIRDEPLNKSPRKPNEDQNKAETFIKFCKTRIREEKIELENKISDLKKVLKTYPHSEKYAFGHLSCVFIPYQQIKITNEACQRAGIQVVATIPVQIEKILAELLSDFPEKCETPEFSSKFTALLTLAKEWNE